MLFRNLGANSGKSKRLLSIVYSFSDSANFDQSKDYYKVLGVSKSSTESQIKSAYYKLAKQYHPDLNKGNQAKIKQINEAYSVLSDANVKRQYQNARQYSQPNSNYQSYGKYSNYNANNYQNYRRNSGFQYQQQDPFQRYRRETYNNNQYGNYNQTNWQQRNSYSQNDYNSHDYKSSYQAYEQFRRQAEQKQRQFYRRKYQEYQEQEHKQDQMYQKQMRDFGSSIRRAFFTGFLISLILIVLSSAKNGNRRPHYVTQPEPAFQVVTVRGYPFLQKTQNPHPNNQYVNYGETLGRNSFNMPGPQTRIYP